MAGEVSTPNCHTLAEEIVAHLQGHGYSRMSPRGLISDAFPGTLAPSAFHDEVLACTQRGCNPIRTARKVGVDWVFRHVDIDRVPASLFHLTSFRMSVFFTVAPSQGDDTELRGDILRQFIGVLRAFELKPQDCLITYFGGGRICGRVLPSDDEIIKLWERCGVDRRQLVRVAGHACFTNCQRPGEPAGPRCEVFLPTANMSMLEIGTIVFERFMIGGSRELLTSDNLVYGGAFGIERIAMLVAGLEDITDIPDIAPLVERLRAGIDSRLVAMCYQQVRGVADGIRTLVVVRDQTEQLDRGRERRVKSVARRVRRYLADLGVEEATGPLVERLSELAARQIGASEDVVGVVLNDLADVKEEATNGGDVRPQRDAASVEIGACPPREQPCC